MTLHRLTDMYVDPHLLAGESIYRPVCSCGWTTWFRPSEDRAVAAWLRHRRQARRCCVHKKETV